MSLILLTMAWYIPKPLGEAAYIGRCRVVPLRNTGSALAPHSAFLLLQGLETLGLRMERHCENAMKVAQHLQKHPKVEWVSYAALADSAYNSVCQKITGGQASGILSFGIKGGKIGRCSVYRCLTDDFAPG